MDRTHSVLPYSGSPPAAAAKRDRRPARRRTIGSGGIAATVAFLVVLHGAPGAARAQVAASPSAKPGATAVATDSAASRAAALQALADRLQLPLLEESVAIFSRQLRRTLPPYFVASIGRQAGLGSQWRPGDASFDDALRQVDNALAGEERRAGPLLRVEHRDLLYAVDIPWTLDDIAFVDETLGTELGRQAQRALDARATLQTTGTLRRRIASGPGGTGLGEAFADLDSRADAQFGDATLMLLPLRATDPERARRLQRLIESVTTVPSDAIGARLVDRLSQRLIDAATTQLPDILARIYSFGTRGR